MPPSPSKPKDRRRLNAWRDGHRGEFWAALYLRLKLYRIVARRVKTPVGEIDIIAHRGGVTVFVEVKARAFSHLEMEALEAVNRRRILRAGEHYVARNPKLADTDLRYDVIFLAPFAWPRHIINAFDMSQIR
jgi:Predicted endonuclease distantly related to archaeal Holliday junction resolvase